MRAAVFSVTERGAELSRRVSAALSERWEVKRFCFERYPSDGAETFSRLSDAVAELFHEYDALIFICACGIAVRATAPLIRSKQTDPAVVVMDDGGKFAISLLSGHIGGANRLAERVAEKVGAQAVITTATDIGGKFSPDSFAAANNLYFSDYSAAKEIAAAVLRGEKIGLRSDYECACLPAGITFSDSGKYGICISHNMSSKPFAVTLNAAPKNIVLGVGCRKGTEYGQLDNFIGSALSAAGIPRECVCGVATIDRKADEPCINRLCETLGVPLIIYTAAQLAAVAGDFSRSEFVKKTVGVDNVCERSAAAGGGRIILKKTAADGMTAAAAERNVLIDFSRKQE